MASRARSMPALMVLATPAAYSVTPAFRMTMFLAGPSWLASTPFSMVSDCSGVSTLMARLLCIGRPKSSGWISYSLISPFFSSPTMVAAPMLHSSMPSRP